MNYQFTEMQLKKLKLSDLRKLATYYSIRYTDETSPNALIGAILQEQGIDKSDPPMSVRVKRIMDSSRKGA